MPRASARGAIFRERGHMKLRAIDDFPYAGRSIKTGDEFDAPGGDARVLILIGKAVAPIQLDGAGRQSVRDGVTTDRQGGRSVNRGRARRMAS